MSVRHRVALAIFVAGCVVFMGGAGDPPPLASDRAWGGITAATISAAFLGVTGLWGRINDSRYGRQEMDRLRAEIDRQRERAERAERERDAERAARIQAQSRADDAVASKDHMIDEMFRRDAPGGHA